MHIIHKSVLKLSVKRVSGIYCFWCWCDLIPCGLCKGSGLYKGSDCNDCNQQGRICPTHQGDWKTQIPRIPVKPVSGVMAPTQPTQQLLHSLSAYYGF